MLPTRTPPAHVPASERMLWLNGTLADLPWHAIERFQPGGLRSLRLDCDAGRLSGIAGERGLFAVEPGPGPHRLRGLGPSHIVGVGTCIEYQITNAPLSEAHTPVAPTTLYSRCKNALREALEAEARRDGWLFCWGRVFYPYGVGEHPARLVQRAHPEAPPRRKAGAQDAPQHQGLHLH